MQMLYCLNTVEDPEQTTPSKSTRANSYELTKIVAVCTGPTWVWAWSPV